MALNWTPRSSPLDGVGGFATRAVWAPGLGLWVAVGGIGDYSVGIVTSPDGVTWTAQGNPFDVLGGYGLSVAWSESLGLLVAGGYSGTGLVLIATSPDGSTWTPQTTGNEGLGAQVNDLAWSESQGMFVAVTYGTATTVMTSPDGVNWTLQTTPFDGGWGGSVAWSEELLLWAATGYDAAVTKTLMTSPDGAAWTAQTSPLDGNQGYWVTWSPTLALFLQAGAGTSGESLATSPDGIVWTRVPTPCDGGSCYSFVEAGGGRFAAAGFNGFGPVLLETYDLSAWASVYTAPLSGSTQAAFAYSPDLDLMLAVGSSGGGAAEFWTNDAAAYDWDPWASPFDTFTGTRGCWSPELGLFAAVGRDQAPTVRIMTSPDGRAWTGRGDPFGGGDAGDVAWSPALGLFVAVGGDGAATSPDGVTWTFSTIAPGLGFGAVAWSESQAQFVAGSSSGIWTSPDGFAWTSQPGIGGAVVGVAYSPDLDLWAAIDNSAFVYTSPDAATWTNQTTPMDGGIGGSVSWLPVAQVFAACGTGGGVTIVTSPDGLAWTALVLPFDGVGAAYFALEGVAGRIFAAGSLGGGPGAVIYYSDDAGATWVPQTSSFDGSNAFGLAFDGDVMIALGFVATVFLSGPSVLSFGVATPDPPDPPVLAGLTPGNTIIDLAWSTPANGGSAITGYNVYRGLAPGGETLLTSLGVTNVFNDTGLTNGVTYYYVVTAVNAVGESDPSNEQSATPDVLTPPGPPTLVTAVAGNHKVTLTWTAPGSDGGSPITGYRISRGTTPGGEAPVATVGVQLTYVDAGLLNGETVYYTVAAINAIGTGPESNELSATPARPPFVAPRFFQGYPWRFIITDLDTVTVSWANGLLTNRQIALLLDEPSVITADVMPNNRQVNEIFLGDDDPRLAQQNRLLYAFRREGGPVPWVIRAAGIVQGLQDQGDPDSQITHISAPDAWRYLDSRPCTHADGQLPTELNPVNFLGGYRGDEIIVALLTATIDNIGPCFIDFGQTSSYGGTIEETELVSFECQPGSMIGPTLSDLCDAGHLDIVLRAIYDPDNRPGITHELSIYNLAGVERPTAVFGWDRMNRALSSIDRMHDGSPGAFVNVVQYFTADGFAVPQQVNALSVAKYRPYWAQQFFPAQPDITGDAITKMAEQAIVLQKQGLRTTTVNPVPQRSQIPLIDYELGDRVKIYASRQRLRNVSAGYQRVQGIPFQLQDDGVEEVAGLLCTPDWKEPPGPEGLYGARASNLTTSDLYAVDGANGNTTPIGPIGYAVTGLAFDPTDLTLYGATSPNSGASPKSLITIDPLTGVGTLVGAFGTGLAMGDLACDSAGNLYGWTSASPGDRCLYSINKTTGAATEVGSTDWALNVGCALAFDADDVLFQMGDGDPGGSGSLYTVNLATSEPTAVAALSGYQAPTGIGVMSAASFKPADGVLYAADNSRDASTPTVYLVTVAVDGTVALVGELDVTGLDALAWAPA